MIYLTHYRTATAPVKELMEDVTFPQRVHWWPDSYSRVNTGLFYVPHRIADKVLDPELVKSIRDGERKKTAFILASGNSSFSGAQPRNVKPNRLTYSYKFLPFALTQVYAGKVAQSFGATDLIMTDATACASSMKVMMDAQSLISVYGFERVIVLAVDDQVNNSVLEFFGESKACLTLEQESAGVAPSAFDSHNHGFYIGQGAALAVFEKEPSSNPVATLRGAYTASEECSNAIGQREDGQGFRRAIQGALHSAGMNPIEVSIVKTHGTGTKSNNVAEKAAILAEIPEFVATSFKPTIGHTMGVSGLLETLLLVDHMSKYSTVPGIAGRTEHDDVFLSHEEAPGGRNVLSLAAGMGNVYSAAVFNIF